ncbi:MAG TPA: DUF1990 domain-containing protein [Lacipirellulaceae bacterium]|jgi:uncharacterized protein (UPF0548 family)|nr:DUF1990 domain-containing protein [Lacipirellulaceae bacterium]
MLTVRKPGIELRRRFREFQSKLDFTYADVGATAAAPPESYTIDRTRIALGEGETVFRSGRRGLERWEQFRLGWLEVWPPETPIRAGETVVVAAHVFGLWSLNAARIVYAIDESSNSISRFGFAYGTLPGHVETGEERFLVEWDKSDNRVWYDILAFSRPRHLLARLGNFQVRRMQRHFAQESAAAMLRAVQ